MRTTATIGIFLFAYFFDIHVYPWIQNDLFSGRSLSLIETGLIMPVLPAIPWIIAVSLMLAIGSPWKWHVFLVGGCLILSNKVYFFLYWFNQNEYDLLFHVWWGYGDLLLTVVAYFATGAFFWKREFGRIALKGIKNHKESGR